MNLQQKASSVLEYPVVHGVVVVAVRIAARICRAKFRADLAEFTGPRHKG